MKTITIKKMYSLTGKEPSCEYEVLQHENEDRTDHSGTYVLASEAEARDKMLVNTVELHKKVIATANERIKVLEDELGFANKRIKQLQFMVDNGLGEADLIDDAHL